MEILVSYMFKNEANKYVVVNKICCEIKYILSVNSTNFPLYGEIEEIILFFDTDDYSVRTLNVDNLEFFKINHGHDILNKHSKFLKENYEWINDIS